MTVPKRQAILIAGMHRSGTSALTRVINLLEVPLAHDLLPPRSDNPRGYWEDKSIVAHNKKLLHHFGLSWHDHGPLPAAWDENAWVTNWCQELGQIVQDSYGQEHRFAVKDPRISRLLPAWKRACEQLDLIPKVIICLRDPFEVAKSLQERAGMPREQAIALWLVYTLEAERTSRDLARTFVCYSQLLEDWLPVIRNVSQTIDVDLNLADTTIREQIDLFLDNSLRHYNAAAAGTADDSPLGQVAMRTFRIGSQAAAGKGPTAAEWDELTAKAQSLLEVLQRTPEPTAPESKSPVGRDTRTVVLDPNLTTPVEAIAETVEASLYFRAYDQRVQKSREIITVVATGSHPMRAQFTLEANARADFIRFDPASLPGVFRIHELSIDGKHIDRSELRISAVNQRQIAPQYDELVRLYSDNDDPYVEFDIRSLHQSGKPLHVVISFDCDTPIQALERHLHRRHHTLDRRLDTLVEKLDSLNALQQETREQLGKLTEKLTTVQRRQSAAIRHGSCGKKCKKRLHTDSTRVRRVGYWHAASLPIQRTEQLELRTQPGAAIHWWSSTGKQPVFHLEIPGEGTPAPGWYLFSMNFSRLDHIEEGPILYVELGVDGAKLTRVPLLDTTASGHHHRLLRLPPGATAFRMVPGNQPGEFWFGAAKLRRLGRLEALGRSGLRAVRDFRCRGASWGAVLRESLATLRKGGITGSTRTLHENESLGARDPSLHYQVWITRHDQIESHDRQVMRAAIGAMTSAPTISLIAPVYNTPELLLRACIDSVVKQIYPNWELCLANDGSTEPHVHRLLDRYAAQDERIKVVHRPTNGHISEASNDAIKLATGEWLAFLDHDDLIPEHALYHVARAIADNPDATLIYTDEDKLDPQGQRYDPYFKPSWDPELLKSQNYVCHLAAYRTDRVRKLGGLRVGYEGSQDHDLVLRYTEDLLPGSIIHIPKILYHWRATRGSEAASSGQKSYAGEAARKAIADHLERTSQGKARVTRAASGQLRIHYPLPSPAPKVSLIIPTRNHKDLLSRCVSSILRYTDYPDYEIIIVDNQSNDPETLAWLEAITRNEDHIRVIQHDEPFNFSRINNHAVAHAKGCLVGLVNNDIEAIESGWLHEMASHAIRESIGAVGAKLFYPDGRIQHAGVILGFQGVAGHAYQHKPRDYPGQMSRALLAQHMSAVTAACLLVKKTAYKKVGGMNEDLAIAFNDIDFCLRLRRAGYRNLWTPHAQLIHHESASRGYEDNREKQARFSSEIIRMRKLWGQELQNDPAYNPNLSLDTTPFAL